MKPATRVHPPVQITVSAPALPGGRRVPHADLQRVAAFIDASC
jgi:hypothetical protein